MTIRATWDKNKSQRQQGRLKHDNFLSHMGQKTAKADPPGNIRRSDWPSPAAFGKALRKMSKQNVLFTRLKSYPRACLAFALILSSRAAQRPAPTPQSDPARQLREYRDVAMGRDGDAARGREL